MSGSAPFVPADLGDVDWDGITGVVVVCFPLPGQVMLYAEAGRWATPHGALAPGEDAWDDTVLPLCLQTMAFRRQGTHVFAVDENRSTAVFWVDGDPDYDGRRRHAIDPLTWTGVAAEAAEWLRAQSDQDVAQLVEMAAQDAASMSRERLLAHTRRTLTGAYLRAASPQGREFWVGDAAVWMPPRTFDVVHLLLDVVPAELHRATIEHWLAHVAPGGRLLVSHYDTRPERSAEAIVRAAGFTPDGATSGPVRRSTGRPYHPASVWIESR